MKIRYNNSCDSCKYLGQYKKYDLYWCKHYDEDYKNLIAVRGDTLRSHRPPNCIILPLYLFENTSRSDIKISDGDLMKLFVALCKAAKDYVKIFETLNEK